MFHANLFTDRKSFQFNAIRFINSNMSRSQNNKVIILLWARQDDLKEKKHGANPHGKPWAGYWVAKRSQSDLVTWTTARPPHLSDEWNYYLHNNKIFWNILLTKSVFILFWYEYCHNRMLVNDITITKRDNNFDFMSSVVQRVYDFINTSKL